MLITDERMAGRRTAARCVGMRVVALLIALGACGAGTDDDTPYAARAFPSGEAVSVGAWPGDAVLLAGWATWCVPCERELPELDAWSVIAPDDLRIVAVNLDTDAVDDDAVAEMLDRLDVDLAVWRDDEGVLLTRYESALMPFSVLLDRDRQVVRVWNGALDPDSDDFAEAVDAALG